MKANELRIGNWVKHDPSWSYRNPLLAEFEFQWDEGYYYGIGECTISIVDISPIPLTEEWLVKLGGIDTNYEITIESENEKIVFEWSSRVIATNIRNGWVCNKYPHIKYVHQLQNLVHALTGEELTLPSEKK